MGLTIDFHDLAAITDTLKYVYGQGITNQFADEKTTYNLFPTSERKPKGLGYEFGIRYARAQGTGARAESEKLPDPLVGKFDKGRILPKYIYGSIRLTGPTIEAAKSDVAAFVDGMSDAVDDIYQSIVVDLNRMCYSDGFGMMGTVKTTKTATFATTYTINFSTATGIKHFKPGMLVDFYSATGVAPTAAAGATAHLGCRVKSVSPASSPPAVVFESWGANAAGNVYFNNHPQYTAANTNTKVNVPAGALAIKSGARAASQTFSSAAGREMMGLQGIYDDDTLLALFEFIDTGTYPDWRANILSNGGVARELSIDLMLQALDLTRTVSGKSANRMFMGLGQRRKYANLLLPDVRFQPTVLKGGYETLTFAGGDGTVSMVVDPMCNNEHIYLEPMGTIQKYEMSPLGWGSIDQQWHQRAGYDEWDAFLRIYSNLGTEFRNSLTLLKDLVEPNLYI